MTAVHPAPVMLGMPALPTSPRGVGHLRGDESFPDAARRSLTDTQLRRNLGKATGTIRAKRAAVVAELPDWEELREAGRQLKVHTMAHLPEYLVQLEAAVSARGGVVHWARDAAEANAIVVDLVELPAADQCCGFGGTFAVKNVDTSTAMLTDKMRNVAATGAEICTAGDSSCLMHIGGGLSRMRAGAKTVHLAQILAATREQPMILAPGGTDADVHAGPKAVA